MKLLQCAFLVLLVALVMASPAMAQAGAGAPATGVSANPNSATFSGAAVGAGLGAAVTIIGAGYGLGRIGSSALESMARQPEVAGRIQTGMIIIAALLEGVTFFSLIVCIIISGKVTF
jgi:F-type H+-transporting ATPase subunit c